MNLGIWVLECRPLSVSVPSASGSSTCLWQNRSASARCFSFPVSASFTPAHVHEGGHGELDINIDLNGWYTDHSPGDPVDTQYDFKTLGDQMIMGNIDAQTKLQTNGPGCFSATLTAHGGHDH